MREKIEINPADLASVTQRVLDRCEALSQVSDDPGQTTRTYLSAATKKAHELVAGWMRHAGLAVRIDAVGNLIGRYGTGDGRFIVGSHLDTVPNAGRFDGVLGVMAGIGLVELLAGQQLPFALEVVGFSEEEGVRFGRPYLGSKAWVGAFKEEWLELQDRAGVTVGEAIRAFGLDPAGIPAASQRQGNLGFLELHIEQGPVLEKMGTPLGLVTAIAGQRRMRLKFVGRAAHAGTCPMDQRNDALAGAAEFVLAVERIGRQTPGLVATVGSADVAPNASNVVPEEVNVSLDVRHANDEVVSRSAATLVESAQRIAGARSLRLELEENGAGNPAVAMDARMIDLLERVAGKTLPKLVSGAGHDAAVMAGFCPSAMLFVRSPGGISHHPDEGVIAADVSRALDVMVGFLAEVGKV